MKKDRGRVKSAIDMVKNGKKGLKQDSPVRKNPSNLFPFVPARPDRPNPLGLYLDKWDCRILRAVQEHGIKSVKELCTLGKIPARKFYERFRNNPDLKEALKLLAYGALASAVPGAMTTLIEKSPSNAKFMELYLKVIGAIDETSFKVAKLPQDEDRLLSEHEIYGLIGGKR